MCDTHKASIDQLLSLDRIESILKRASCHSDANCENENFALSFDALFVQWRNAFFSHCTGKQDRLDDAFIYSHVMCFLFHSRHAYL